MVTYTIEEINAVVGGLLNKVEDVKISKIYPPLLADENTLALALGEDEIQNLSQTKAKAVLVPLGVTIDGMTTIEVERPRLAMMKLLNMFYRDPETEAGIHPTAVVHPTATLGKNVSIGPNVVISHDAKIGDNTKIMANSYIGGSAKIGENCFFHANVNVGDRVEIGNQVILHHGVCLGSDGFSFVTENPDNIEQARKDGAILEENVTHKIFKIPSIGSVQICDNVEIGANTTIDRGTIENTVVGEDTKIDDQVMIGHNCKIGKGCMIVSQVGIAGSCVIGDRVVIAGKAGLADHINIGSDSIVGAAAGVSKSFPEKSIIIGTPAVPRKEFIRQLKTMKDAEELIKKFKKYEPLLRGFEDAGKD